MKMDDTIDFSCMPIEESVIGFYKNDKQKIEKIICDEHDLKVVAISLKENDEKILFCPLCITNPRVDVKNILFFEHINKQKIKSILENPCFEIIENIFKEMENKLKGNNEEIQNENKKLNEEFDKETSRLSEICFDKIVHIKETLMPLVNTLMSESILETEKLIIDRLNLNEIYKEISQIQNNDQINKLNRINKLKEFITNYNFFIKKESEKFLEQVKIYNLHKEGNLINRIKAIFKEVEDFINEKFQIDNILQKQNFNFNTLKKPQSICILDNSNKVAQKKSEIGNAVIAMDLILEKGNEILNWGQTFSGLKKNNQFIATGIIEEDDFTINVPTAEYLKKKFLGVSSSGEVYNMNMINPNEKELKLKKNSQNINVYFTFNSTDMFFTIQGCLGNFESKLNCSKKFVPMVILGHPGNTVEILE